MSKGIDIQAFKNNLYDLVQFVLSNDDIKISVKTLLPNTDYIIESERTEAKYNSGATPDAGDILNNLRDLINANTDENVSASVVGTELVITKNNASLVWFFKLSGNLQYAEQGLIIWQDQNSPQPSGQYVTMKLTAGPDQIGLDDNMTYQSGSPDSYLLSGMDLFTLNIQTLGKDSLQTMEKIKDSFNSVSILSYANSLGLTIMIPETITDVTALLETTYEQRYSLDLSIYIRHAIISNVSTIEDVTITKI